MVSMPGAVYTFLALFSLENKKQAITFFNKFDRTADIPKILIAKHNKDQMEEKRLR